MTPYPLLLALLGMRMERCTITIRRLLEHPKIARKKKWQQDLHDSLVEGDRLLEIAELAITR